MRVHADELVDLDVDYSERCGFHNGGRDSNGLLKNDPTYQGSVLVVLDEVMYDWQRW
jgi:hypothetical protein